MPFRTPFSGDVLPNVPRAQEGGILRCPSLALVGEGGPEAIVPLGRGLICGVTINIQGNAIIDDENRMNKLVREIERLLAQSARTGLGI